MNLYDTHCHLDLLSDKKKVIEEINRSHIYVMAMTNLPDIYRKEKELYDSKYVRTCLGFHPELIEEYWHQMELMWQLLPDAKYIGEVGLDFQTAAGMHKQMEFLRELFERCNNYDSKIISLHSRDAIDELLGILPEKRTFVPILHWFTGNTKQLKKAIDLGCYFSVNLSMIGSSKFHQFMQTVPCDRLLIETDAPFAHSAETYEKTLREINNKIIEVYGMPMDKLFLNFKTLLMNSQKY